MIAHRAMESITLDKTMHQKDEIMPKYAELIYNTAGIKARFKLQKIVNLKKIKERKS